MKKAVKAYAFALETVPLFGLGYSQSAESPEIERRWQ